MSVYDASEQEQKVLGCSPLSLSFASTWETGGWG